VIFNTVREKIACSVTELGKADIVGVQILSFLQLLSINRQGLFQSGPWWGANFVIS
jgi:hypothetical protein